MPARLGQDREEGQPSAPIGGTFHSASCMQVGTFLQKEDQGFPVAVAAVEAESPCMP